MSAARDLAALPAALRRLAAALDEVLALAGPPPHPSRPAARDASRPSPTDATHPATADASRRSPATGAGGRRLCAHADLDGAGMHFLDAGQPCPRAAVPGIPADAEAVVAALWPPLPLTAALMRDVEARPRSDGSTAYRGRVRWIDPATGRYRGQSRTFAAPADAWAWIATYTTRPPARPAAGTAR